MDQTGSDAKTDFAHVLWIGGASDAGKTTVARLLAERRRWQWYPCDFHEHNHLIARADPERQPAIYAEFQKSVEERWIQPTPEELFQVVLETNHERFPMILDDLRAMPSRPLILVEGPRLFPKLLTPLLPACIRRSGFCQPQSLRANQSSDAISRRGGLKRVTRNAIERTSCAAMRCWPRTSGGK